MIRGRLLLVFKVVDHAGKGFRVAKGVNFNKNATLKEILEEAIVEFKKIIKKDHPGCQLIKAVRFQFRGNFGSKYELIILAHKNKEEVIVSLFPHVSYSEEVIFLEESIDNLIHDKVGDSFTAFQFIN